MISSAQNFVNPILAGFYPDPSICRAGNDYYIVTSSFAYFPGLPVFHSKDLLNWQQVGAALNRPEQLNLDGAGVSRGLFAPSIAYHKGVFYIVCTLVDNGGNFVITAADPKGPWSQPVWLPEIDGIDPSIFFDENDRTWIVYNSNPPENKSAYDGHRTIRTNELDIKQLKIISENKIIVNGGTDITKKPIWIEAPHLLKKDGWYYLICAEGGTGYDHSEVVFRSKSVDGPFVPYEKNPILSQRHLDPARKNPITTAGHADMVETPDGKWFAVFLACRPYEGDYYNIGRETFMAPVQWKDGWPIINPDHAMIQYTYPIISTVDKAIERLNGNYLFKDDFKTNKLSPRYSFLRTVRENWYNVDKGNLTLKLRPQTCSGKENPSFVGFRQPHLKGHASTAIWFAATASNEKAGLLVFQSEQHYYFLCQSLANGKPVVQLYKGTGNKSNATAAILMTSMAVKLKKDNELLLKITANGDTYSFFYATQPSDWKLLKANADAKFLSTKEAGGFVGCMYAMYATSDGLPTNAQASYHWFECMNEDDVYKLP
ncbi:MAG: glycoside hydrolase family 43 protein [Ferruginibacter sp.]